MDSPLFIPDALSFFLLNRPSLPLTLYVCRMLAFSQSMSSTGDSPFFWVSNKIRYQRIGPPRTLGSGVYLNHLQKEITVFYEWLSSIPKSVFSRSNTQFATVYFFSTCEKDLFLSLTGNGIALFCGWVSSWAGSPLGF